MFCCAAVAVSRAGLHRRRTLSGETGHRAVASKPSAYPSTDASPHVEHLRINALGNSQHDSMQESSSLQLFACY